MINVNCLNNIASVGLDLFSSDYNANAAFEEADHASRYAEMLGEVVSASTKENLEARVAAENGASKGKTAFAKKCKEMNLDALHDSIHEMARDESRHGQAFLGMLNRYFKK